MTAAMRALRSLLACLAAALTLTASAGVARGAALLELGSRGEQVRALSEQLAFRSFLPADGVSGRYTEATYHAVVAFQKYAGIRPDGAVGPKTLRALLRSERPQPVFSGKDKRVEVSLGKQLAFLVRGGVVVRTIAVSTARPGYTTPSGRFSVYRKERMSWSAPYGVWLPWASYFSGGVAFHSYPDVPSYPASHGCIRVPPPFAEALYTFASYGTPVILG